MEQMEIKDFIEMPKEDGVYSTPWTFKKNMKIANAKKNVLNKRRRVQRPPFKEFMDYYLNHPNLETAEHFGITDRTIYNWLKKYTEEGHTLNEIAIQR